MKNYATKRSLLLLLTIVLTAFTAVAEERLPANKLQLQSASSATGRTVVVWISIDGMRGDYVDLAETPFLSKLMQAGAYSKKLTPVFPSLTFPSHVAQVTGASVNRHGIIANAIYDLPNDRRWNYPNVASEITCEPIWNTVKRSGRRVLVYDWPVSQQQAGEFKADYFDKSFDTALTDEQRLNRLLETWKNDEGNEPLQLIMGYVGAVDKAGHKYGPEASETKKAVAETDALLAKFFEQCESLFKQKYAADDRLIFLLTTDHGMEDLKFILNIVPMCGDAWHEEMRALASGSVVNIFLERLGPPPARAPYAKKLIEVLKAYPFAHAYTKDQLPKNWAYDHPTRTGDVVVSVDPGYFFSEKGGSSMQTVDPQQGPLGMHGYLPSKSDKMLGLMVVWDSQGKGGGKDLGVIDCRRLHSSVAHWLKVPPAETAVNKPIDLN